MNRVIKKAWRIYKKNPRATLGFTLVFICSFIAIFCPLIARSPFDTSGPRFSEPNMTYLFGTDDLGRDTFSQVLYGIRISMIIGVCVAGVSGIIGTLVGVIAGYCGGIIDSLLMRITEIFLVIPSFFLDLLLMSFFGRSVWFAILVLSVLSWPGVARIARAEFLSLKELPYVEAAKVVGCSNKHIIFREILPNALPPIIVTIVLIVPRAIILEAGLSFMGLWDPNNMSLGYLLENAKNYFMNAWWMLVFPALALFLLSLGFNLTGDVINEELNPRFRRKI